MTKLVNLNENPGDFPEAMAKATRTGRMQAMERRSKIFSVSAVSILVLPGCANGFATPLKQAYNADYWSASL